MPYFREFQYVAFGRRDRQGVFVLIACYLDESSDSQGRDILTVAGFMQHNSNWLIMEYEWDKILQRPEIDIPFFRATDCLNVSGVFAKYRADPTQATDEERQRCAAVRTALMASMKGCSLVGSSVSIALSDYYDVYKNEPNAKRHFSKDPLYTGLQYEMQTVVEGVSRYYPNEKVAFVYDERRDISKHIEAVYSEMKANNPTWAKYMGSLSHMDDKDTPPLQAADLLGSEVRLRTQALWAGTKTAEEAFDDLTESVNYWHGGRIDRQAMLNIIADNASFASPNGRRIAAIFPEKGLLPPESFA